MRSSVNMMGVPVDNVTMQDALNKVASFLTGDRTHIIYTPNSEIMMAAYRDLSLREILGQADLLVADGAGVVLASGILGNKLPEKVAGFDLVINILTNLGQNKIRFFLFGGNPGVAEAAAEKILNTYPGAEIAGCRNGYFEAGEEDEIIKEINSSKTDILLVGLGAPKQEIWIHKQKNGLNVKVCIGVGGTLDVFAGKVKLAPDFFRKNYLEWLYRLYKEPRRYKRMLDLPRFILLAIRTRITGIY